MGQNGINNLKVPFLYSVIERYEYLFRDLGFNKVFLTPEIVLSMIEKLGVVIVEDTTFKGPFLVMGEKKKLLVYNPKQPHDMLILQLGHELGHLICEHYEVKKGLADPVLEGRLEREADMIGYLCFIPSLEIKQRLQVYNSFEYVFESLFHKMRNCDIEERELISHLHARIRIFKAYQRVLKSILAQRFPLFFSEKS
ncbi:MAG: ImmA/IrrE family metallo-endopeptidase [Desulfurococcaceae archaeon]